MSSGMLRRDISRRFIIIYYYYYYYYVGLSCKIVNHDRHHRVARPVAGVAVPTRTLAHVASVPDEAVAVLELHGSQSIPSPLTCFDGHRTLILH